MSVTGTIEFLKSIFDRDVVARERRAERERATRIFHHAL